MLMSPGFLGKNVTVVFGTNNPMVRSQALDRVAIKASLHSKAVQVLLNTHRDTYMNKFAKANLNAKISVHNGLIRSIRNSSY